MQARHAGSLVLLIVGLANIAYGLYRLSEGREGNSALFGVGLMVLVIAMVLMRTSSTQKPDP